MGGGQLVLDNKRYPDMKIIKRRQRQYSSNLELKIHRGQMKSRV